MEITVFSTQDTIHISSGELADRLKIETDVIWVDIDSANEQEVTLIEQVFNFHPLTIEDIRHQEQRPKAEEFSDYLFVILNPMYKEAEDLHFRELDVFIGQNYLVTAHHNPEPVIQHAFTRLDPTRSKFSISPTYLFYVVMDTVVDGYFPILESIDEEIETLGSTILAHPNQTILNRLFELKSSLSHVWKVLVPQRDIVNTLMSHDLVFNNQNSQYHLRDIADHLSQATDAVHYQRETLTNLANLYVSAVSHQLNYAVGRFTILAIIIGTLGVISGFYGMNFERTWPPFAHESGVVIVIGIMAAVVSGLFVILQILNKTK